MEKVINSFKDRNFFLSNFYTARVTYGAITYLNNEAAFQAQKTESLAERQLFSTLNPSEAKKKGRHVKLRSDWEEVKEQVMYDICLCKFTQNRDLGKKLLDTGDAFLEEGNDWGDRTWGTVNGEGQNLLGKILMDVRKALRREFKEEKLLVVTAMADGTYHGSTKDGLVFDVSADILFPVLKEYTDNGFTLKCIKGVPKTVRIWRYENIGPFHMGGPSKTPIATDMDTAHYEAMDLGKGFYGLVVASGKAKGVYELTSGGLVGDTVEDVRADIEACDDISIMKEQVEEAAMIRNMAHVCGNVQFGLPEWEDK